MKGIFWIQTGEQGRAEKAYWRRRGGNGMTDVVNSIPYVNSNVKLNTVPNPAFASIAAFQVSLSLQP